MTNPLFRLALPVLMSLSWLAAAPAQERARLKVFLPPTDVQLEIQGVVLAQKPGVVERLFESPTLIDGKSYIYDIKATWMENGKPVVRERSVKVMGGQTTEVDLRNTDEPVPDKNPSKTPMPDKPMGDKPDKPMGDKPDKPMPDKPMPDKPMPDKPMPDKPPIKPSDIYTAAPPEVVDNMLKLAKVKESDVVFVIGCADGRIANTAAVVAKARKVTGIDANADRLATARKNAEAGKVNDRVEFKLGDPTKVTDMDLAEATVVTLDNMTLKQIADLAPVLKKLKPGTRIVSHPFDIPGLKYADKRELVVGEQEYVIYLYEVK
jgi:uncharacterized protein (TIGR03000 family)